VFNLVEKEYHHWIQHGILVQIGIVQYSVRQYWPLVAVERPNGTKRSNIFESPEQFRAPDIVPNFLLSTLLDRPLALVRIYFAICARCARAPHILPYIWVTNTGI